MYDEKLQRRLSVAIAHEIIPEFEYVADRLLERYEAGARLGTTQGAADLSFGAGDVPQELIDLFVACIPIIKFLAGIGLGGFLPAYLSGRAAKRQHQVILEMLRRQEEKQSRFRADIRDLTDAYRKVRGTGDTEDIRDMVARALTQVENKESEPNVDRS